MDFLKNFFELLLWTAYFAIWISFIFLMIKFVFDVFRDEKLPVIGKIAWTLFLVILPVIGAIVYIIARGRSMAERDVESARSVRAAQVEYTKGLMQDAGPASEIKAAKELLDAGAINEDEYQALKSKALATV